MRRPLLILAAPALAAVLLLSSAASLSAQAGAPTVTTRVESRFPDGLHFDVTIAGPVEIAEARVRFRVLGERATRNAPLEFDPSRRMQAGPLGAHRHPPSATSRPAPRSSTLWR